MAFWAALLTGAGKVAKAIGEAKKIADNPMGLLGKGAKAIGKGLGIGEGSKPLAAGASTVAPKTNTPSPDASKISKDAAIGEFIGDLVKSQQGGQQSNNVQEKDAFNTPTMMPGYQNASAPLMGGAPQGTAPLAMNQLPPEVIQELMRRGYGR